MTQVIDNACRAGDVLREPAVAFAGSSGDDNVGSGNAQTAGGRSGCGRWRQLGQDGDGGSGDGGSADGGGGSCGDG